MPNMNNLQWSWILFLIAVPLGYIGGDAGIIALIIMVIGLVLYIKGLVGVIKHGFWGTRFHFIFATTLYTLLVLGLIIGIFREFYY
jgi:hypothetical protein